MFQNATPKSNRNSITRIDTNLQPRREELESWLAGINGLDPSTLASASEDASFRHYYLGVNSEGRIAPYMVGFSTTGTWHDENGETKLRQALPVTANGSFLHRRMLKAVTNVRVWRLSFPKNTKRRVSSCSTCIYPIATKPFHYPANLDLKSIIPNGLNHPARANLSTGIN